MKPEVKYGTIRDIEPLDDQGSTLTIITKVAGGDMQNRKKQYSERIKVFDHKHEMAEYIRFTETIKDKMKTGVLVVSVRDPELIPCFKIEYPSSNIDGGYFVIKSWTEVVK